MISATFTRIGEILLTISTVLFWHWTEVPFSQNILAPFRNFCWLENGGHIFTLLEHFQQMF
jgi:hypothetical protein